MQGWPKLPRDQGGWRYVNVHDEYESDLSDWDAETGNDGMYGNAYSTALALLALGAPNQLLPVFQR